MINTVKKQEIVKNFGATVTDTGSTAVQIALLTERINSLTKHLEQNRKDFSSKRGLLKFVGARRRLLRYLERTNYAQYRELLEKLKLRK